MKPPVPQAGRLRILCFTQAPVACVIENTPQTSFPPNPNRGHSSLCNAPISHKYRRQIKQPRQCSRVLSRRHAQGMDRHALLLSPGRVEPCEDTSGPTRSRPGARLKSYCFSTHANVPPSPKNAMPGPKLAGLHSGQSPGRLRFGRGKSGRSHKTGTRPGAGLNDRLSRR